MLRQYLYLLLLVLGTLNISDGFAMDEKNFQMPENPVIVMETSQGTIEFKLRPDLAPKACENMIRLAEKGYYDDTTFHRVIQEFMIQGGDPEGTGRGGSSVWGKNFEDECHEDVCFDRPGLLAMANAGPGTNGSQFFITTVKTPWLNMRHTIFGEVVKGEDIVKKIETTAVDHFDRPVETQKIVKIRLKKAGVKA